jgi:D-proline reductase (dithiol) PrdB
MQALIHFIPTGGSPMNEVGPYRSFVSYIDRSREYYAAHGYERPYAWPHYRDVPFAPLHKPLSQCRVGLVTTAGKIDPRGALESLMPKRESYAAPTDPAPAHLRTDDLSWDKKETHTDDVDSFLPVNRLAEAAASGRIGSVSPRFYGAPTDYSKSNTIERDAPRILEWCREDGLDAVLLAGL